MAAGRPSHLASDTWTQSQFQLEGNANARLKDVPFGSLSFGGPELLKKIFILNSYCYTVNPAQLPKSLFSIKRHHAKKKVHSLRQMYSDASLRNEKVQLVWRSQQKCVWAAIGCLFSAFHFLAQNVEVL